MGKKYYYLGGGEREEGLKTFKRERIERGKEKRKKERKKKKKKKKT